MPVKFRTVDTDKFYSSTDINTASAAHSCTIYHYCIKRYKCMDIIRAGSFCTEFHHYGWTDSTAGGRWFFEAEMRDRMTIIYPFEPKDIRRKLQGKKVYSKTQKMGIVVAALCVLAAIALSQGWGQ